MNSLAELFTEFISRNKTKEEDYNFFGSENKTKQITTTIITDDEIINKMSTSFTSNLNNLNEINIEDTQVANQTKSGIKINSEISKNLHNSQSMSSDSDSECDLYMIASFWKYKIALTPKQKNGDDCGVFLCKFIDYISRDAPINFSQEDIIYFRYMIGVELMEGKLL